MEISQSNLFNTHWGPVYPFFVPFLLQKFPNTQLTTLIQKHRNHGSLKILGGGDRERLFNKNWAGLCPLLLGGNF